MATVKDKVIPTMVTSYSHDRDLKIQYPIYTIINRSYTEISRLLEQNHTVELNDQGMIVKLDKDKLINQIVPLYGIELEINKVKEANEGTDITSLNNHNMLTEKKEEVKTETKTIDTKSTKDIKDIK